ncbi:MAG: phosphate ABC transporter permease PstA [Spirochaetaceae bacterium]|jgi:phosphate transport system permease protein|nr:phosphate ABC transporter permease PstA [Spirochaetaceae bacterium]
MPLKEKINENIMHVIVCAAAAITSFIFLYIAGFILIRGIPNIKPSLFALVWTSENSSLTPALVSTVILTFVSLLIAAPLGVFAAVWLAEYTRRTSKKSGALIRITAETLAGIPSVVYGLFGLLFFVQFLGLGFSLISGALTLSLMILPFILRSTEEALRSVPDTWREGSFGLGAGKLRTVFKVVLPAAAPGVLAGIILSIGRIVAESAALIYTAGTVAQIPKTPSQSVRTLAVHVYSLSSEGLHINEAYATASVLLIVVVAINTIAAVLAKKIGGGLK